MYRDSAFRAQSFEQLKRRVAFGNSVRITLREARNTALKHLEGRAVAQIAAEWGEYCVDTFFNISLEDDLENEFTMQTFNTRIERIAELLNDRSILLGMDDGEEYPDMRCDAGYPSYVPEIWVHEQKVLLLEEARRVSSDPTDFFDIKDRGRIVPCLAADLLLSDLRRFGFGRAPRSAAICQAHGDALGQHRAAVGGRRADMGNRRAYRSERSCRATFVVRRRPHA